MRRAPAALLCGAALVLAACTSSANASDPTWVPSPDFGTNGEGPGVELTPIVPKPAQSTPQSGPGSRSGGQSGGSNPGPSTSGKGDPAVVATKLRAPVGLALLPDGTALVGERTTGRIVRVQPRPNQPVPTVRTLTGLDTSGDGGLLDLALSPTYAQDNLIYAYVTTRTDNRVVDFTLTGPVTPVLTRIPKGRTGNTGRITFGNDGNLYVGTGDTGQPSLAANPRSLAGKVLRVSDIGAPVAANPSGTAVWTSGHHGVDGLCTGAGNTGAASTAMFEVESGRPGEINVLGAGRSYGWPAPTAASTAPIATMPTGYDSPGDCTVGTGTLFVTSLDGRAVLQARIVAAGDRVSVGKFNAPFVHNVYGRLKTIVAAGDGSVWMTTSNRDGHGKPVTDDERVIRYVPTGGGGGGNPA